VGSSTGSRAIGRGRASSRKSDKSRSKPTELGLDDVDASGEGRARVVGQPGDAAAEEVELQEGGVEGIAHLVSQARGEGAHVRERLPFGGAAFERASLGRVGAHHVHGERVVVAPRGGAGGVPEHRARAPVAGENGRLKLVVAAAPVGGAQPLDHLGAGLGGHEAIEEGRAEHLVLREARHLGGAAVEESYGGVAVEAHHEHLGRFHHVAVAPLARFELCEEGDALFAEGGLS
jgi:hypothetical protein